MHIHGSLNQPGRERQILILSAALTLLYVLAAFLTGLWSHSLALISEAGHNLTDFLALLLSWLGVYLQAKPPDASRTYGFHRAGVLAAFLNVLTLGGLTCVIIWNALARLRYPSQVHTGPMLAVAAAGVVLNTGIAFLLHPSGSHRQADVNMRAAFLHMLGDAVSTALVVVGALLIRWTGRDIIDPLLSLLIAAFILWSSWGVLLDTVNILLEATPRGVDADEVCHALESIPGVRSVHDLHIWSLASKSHALSAHIQIDDIPPSESGAILASCRQLLSKRYRILHTTIQFESAECEVQHGCVIPVTPPHHMA